MGDANQSLFRDSLTALVLTYNEQENIARTLASIDWVPRVIVVDSGSTDRTTDLVGATHPSTRMLHRDFDSFANQCNFGLTHIDTEWVLSMGADYVLTPEVSSEIAALNPTADIAGYSVKFRYCIFGRPLRSTVYPARTVLYRRNHAQYRDEGHGHRVIINGKVEELSGKIDHDDRKPLSHWIQAQDRYSTIEARHLLVTPLN